MRQSPETKEWTEKLPADTLERNIKAAIQTNSFFLFSLTFPSRPRGCSQSGSRQSSRSRSWADMKNLFLPAAVADRSSNGRRYLLLFVVVVFADYHIINFFEPLHSKGSHPSLKSTICF